MTAPTVTTIIQQTNVDYIGSVVVTTPTQDPNTNLWVRQFRIMGPPDINGNAVQIFCLQVSAVAETGIEISAPPNSF